MPCLLEGLRDLVGRYDVLLCDVWGVVHDGRAAFPVPCRALARWRAEVGPVTLISNSPRLTADVERQLEGLGAPCETWSALVTSGDVTRGLLARRAPGPAYALGPDRDRPLYEGLGLAFAPIDKAAFISCTGLFDDDTETPEDYRDLLARGVSRRLEMICANPDKVVQRGDRLVYCAGALAELYQQLGGAVRMAGKPHAPIYEASLKCASALMAGRLDRRRVLAVGDGVATDMAGAAAQSLDALYVARGIHAAETLSAGGRVDGAAVDALLARSGLLARFAMTEIAW
jgi:HAD superfamily hydrolase (TIGR01459 family)